MRYLIFSLLVAVLILVFPVGAAFADSVMPEYGGWVCDIIYRLTFWLPKTPNQYWMGTLVAKLSDNLPFVGSGILLETVNILKSVLVLTASWKVYKSLPGKF